MFSVLEVAYAQTPSAATEPHSSIFQMLLFPAFLIVIFYFLLIRPQNKRAKEQRMMLNKLTVGDEIVTASGILGRVTRLQDAYVICQVAHNVEITVQKSAVSTVLPKGTLEN